MQCCVNIFEGTLTKKPSQMIASFLLYHLEKLYNSLTLLFILNNVAKCCTGTKVKHGKSFRTTR